MSNLHVLKQTAEKHEARVVFHIAVPNENNYAQPTARSLFYCVKTDTNPTGSLVPDLQTTHASEYQDILDGKVRKSGNCNV